MAFKKRNSESEARKPYPQMSFRVDDAEKAFIEAAAEREGLTPGSYMRSRCLTKPTTRAVRRPPVGTAQLAQLLGLLGSAGGAVQMIAQKHGENGVPVDEIQQALILFRQAATAILQTLGKRPPLPTGRAP